ncbi:MAG: hypothetical protein D3923_03400 [Candidatus Electrothrix sp. AR3]|nr:hypothetical protein [Candidatus Electrothrix sp. AR3]
MAEFSFQEPLYLALGQEIYQQHTKDQGNAVSILSDAMATLRQLGLIGLDLWIDSKSGERIFIREAINKGTTAERLGLAHRLQSIEERKKTQPREENMDAAWNEMENLMRVLRYAKYYAKTQDD